MANKTAHIEVRVSDNEKSALKEFSKQTGLSVSEFVRRAALGQRIDPVKHIPAINRCVYLELLRVGTNLNQIAHKLNSGQGSDKERLVNAISQTVKLTKEVRLAILSETESDD